MSFGHILVISKFLVRKKSAIMKDIGRNIYAILRCGPVDDKFLMLLRMASLEAKMRLSDYWWTS